MLQPFVPLQTELGQHFIVFPSGKADHFVYTFQNDVPMLYYQSVCSVRLACATGSFIWLNRYWNLGRLAIGTKRRTNPR